MKNHKPFDSNEIDNILDEIEENEKKQPITLQQIDENIQNHAATTNYGSTILDVHLFDKVSLPDSAEGIVKFIGNINGKNGLFYGIDITKGKGLNNGCINKNRYFRTKNNTKSGRFIQKSQIVTNIKTPKSIRFTIGDTIKCPRLNTTAVIKYVGIPAFDKTMKTVHFGIELAEAKGDCDGQIYSTYLGKKVSYFKCQKNYGLYVKCAEISINYISNKYYDRINELEGLLEQQYAEMDKIKSASNFSLKSAERAKALKTADKNVYEWTEITKHNNKKDLWIVYHDKVYDLTRFLKFHPGGIESILQITQKSQDITKPLSMLNHPPITDKILLKHFIGNIKNASNALQRSWDKMQGIWDSENKTFKGSRMVTNVMSQPQALITWSDVFSVRIDVLDKQHENLANIINGLHIHYRLKDIVELLRRWDVHAKTEETLFFYYGFEESLQEAHKKDHREIYHKIKDTITNLRIKYNNEKPQCEELIAFAKAAAGIFKKHHFGFDTQYIEHLDNVNVQMFE